MKTDLPTECPYRGLHPYTEVDREYFFGRERDRIVIASNLVASPLTILYGGSGVGKTSVLLAAVVPYLAGQAAASPVDTTTSRLTTVTFRAWQRPDFSSALRWEVLNAMRARKRRAGEPQGDIDIDVSLPFDEFLIRCIDVLDGRLLFIFDQFEEYFLNPADLAEVLTFEAEFARVVNGREIDAHFLLSLREEELSKLDRFQGRIPNLLNNTLRVEQLDREAGRDAIRKPLERYNQKFALPDDQKIRIEDELVEALLDKATPLREAPDKTTPPEAGTPAKTTAGGVETPVLQILLTRLWSAEMKQGSRVLRWQTFNEQLGGAEKIVSTFFKEVMKGLSDPEREIAAGIFQFLVTQSGTKIALAPKTLTSWAGLKSDMAEKNVRDLLDKLSSYQVDSTHSTRNPGLSPQDIRIVRKVTAPNQPDRYEIFHDVLGGAIKEWRTDYLQAKLTGAEKKKQQFKVGFSALVVIAIAIAVLAVLTTWGAIEARKDRKFIASRLLEFKTLDSSVPFFQAVMRGHTDPVRSASFSNDAQLLVTAGADGTARVWDVQNGEVKFELRGHREQVNRATFSDDGKLIVTAGADRTARVWDASNGQLVKTLMGHADNVIYATFAPGGLIVTASADGTARVWNAQSGQTLHELRGHTGPINSAMLGAGQPVLLLLTASADGTARLWDLGTGAQVQIFTVGPIGATVEVKDAALSKDGRLVVTAHSDKTASVWNVANGQRLASLVGHEGVVNSASFSNDGEFVATGSADNTVRVWDARSGHALRTLEGHRDEVSKAVFSSDGRWLITISDDDTARVWEVSTGSTLAELRGHIGNVSGLDLHGAANLVATSSADKTARVWNVAELSTVGVAKPVLAADPSNYNGKCPVTIKFTGRIEVVGSGGRAKFRVKYQFVRSSREKSEERELIFDSPGSKEVTDTWRLGEGGFTYGWETIRILEPQRQESEKAEFRINCPQPSPMPTPELPPATPDPFEGFPLSNIRSEQINRVAWARFSLVTLARQSAAITDDSGPFQISASLFDCHLYNFCVRRSYVSARQLDWRNSTAPTTTLRGSPNN